MRKVLVVVLLLLIGGAIAADRIGVRKAEDEISKQVAAQYDLTSRPDVSIHGFPFLTQALGGNYHEIDVTLGEWSRKDVTVRDATLRLTGVAAPLSDVLNGDTSQITVANATASVVVPYASLQRYAPKGVTGMGASGKNLQARVTGTFLGFNVTGNLVASLKATPKGISVTPQSISSDGTRVPLALLQQRYTFTVPMQDLLPLGARITDLQVTPGGLRISATADDLKLENLSTV